MAKLWAAVDVGGTFIDVVVADITNGRLKVAKVANQGASQAAELLTILREFAGELGYGAGDIESVIIGTTAVTNALLQGKVARTALVTTEGFKDMLAIARMARASSYDLQARRPPPLVPEELSFEVKERLGVRGEVVRALDESSVLAIAETLGDTNIGAIAISLLYSYENPDHERRVAEILHDKLNVPISLSSDVLPVFREFERTSTTVVNAATLPIIGQFFNGLGQFTDQAAKHVYIMASEGGCLTTQEAQRRPAATILSGPAGGVVGAAHFAAQYGHRDVLTLDVGGTSTDVALLRQGLPPYTSDRTVGGYSVALPSIEVHTIGAGGGSIASLDKTGLLRVGPESAGADPGPICYLRGGAAVTVTDCYVALGMLGEKTMLGGQFAIDREAALRGIEQKLAIPLGANWVRAAQGVLEVVTANIVRAVRKISVERGYDPRKAILVPFGGAGPIHALEVARSLEIPQVVVPSFPGVFSAFGMLGADIRYPAYRTWFRDLPRTSARDLREAFAQLEEEVGERAKRDGFALANVQFERSVDLRYQGQSYTLTISAKDRNGDPAALAEAFHQEHERWYGHSDPQAALELVNLRLTLVWPRLFNLRPELSGNGHPEGSIMPAYRSVWLAAAEPIRCPVYRRDQLRRGEVIEGPAIVEQYDSTVMLAAGDRMEVMDNLDLLIRIGLG